MMNSNQNGYNQFGSKDGKDYFNMVNWGDLTKGQKAGMIGLGALQGIGNWASQNNQLVTYKPSFNYVGNGLAGNNGNILGVQRYGTMTPENNMNMGMVLQAMLGKKLQQNKQQAEPTVNPNFNPYITPDYSLDGASQGKAGQLYDLRYLNQYKPFSVDWGNDAVLNYKPSWGG